MQTLKSLLTLIPAKYRKYIYIAGGVASFLYTIYLSVDGDWRKALYTLGGMVLAALASANTDETPKPDPDQAPVA